MLKKFAIFAATLAVFTMISLAYITARYIDQEEILRVQLESEELKKHKKSLEAQVATLESNQLKLNETIATQTQEIATNQVMIAKLEQSRIDNQLQVRKLSTENELEKAFSATYPQLINVKHFGITQIEDPTTKLTLPFYVIPAWFAETFIIEHNNMLSFEKQNTEYQANEKLYGSILDLKDQVFKLETEKSAAYKTGYDEAYAKYEKLNEDYVTLLKEPPTVELKPPSLWTVLGGTALGLALGIGI